MSRQCGQKPQNRNKKCYCDYKKIKQMGFILVVFGLITICAFFLPIQAWIILLGIVITFCGLKLLR